MRFFLIRGLSVVGLSTSIIFVAAALAADFETPPVLRAEDLVDAELLQGPNYKLDPEVNNDGYMNHFTVRSDFGDFEAASELLLENRIREVYALAKLAEISKSDAFVDALGAAATGTVEAVANVVTDPVGTVQGIGAGVNRMFKGYKYKGKKAKHQAEAVVAEEKAERAAKQEAEAAGEETGEEAADEEAGSGEPSTTQKAGKAAKSLLGWDKAKRQLAQSLQVDPYTDNEVLQAELNRVAQAAFAANLGVRFGMPSIPGMSYVNKANQMVWTLPPGEVERLNDVALTEAGVDEAVRLDFFANPNWPLSYEAIFVQSLSEMESTRNRQVAVEIAVSSDTSLVSYLFALSARVLYGYHELVEPIAEIRKLGDEKDGHFFAGVSESGKLIVPIAFDYVIWQEELASEGPAYAWEQREVWSAGRLSDTCQEQLEERGWKVNSRVLVPWNQQLAARAEAAAKAAEAESAKRDS